MGTSGRGKGGKQGRKERDLSKKDKRSRATSSPSSSTSKELLLWLKRLALTPGNADIKRESVEKLWDQMLTVRKLLFLDKPESRRSKRQLERVLGEGKISSASALSSGKSDHSNIKKNRRKLSHPVSSLHLESSSPQTVDVSSPSSSGNKVLSHGNDDALVSSSDGPSSPGEHQEPKEVSVTEDENNRRPVIPVGPGFQAEIPDWIGPARKGKHGGDYGDTETLRWLGTKVWPVQRRGTKAVNKEVGKGRPDSCSCVSPGSSDCIKHHTQEARQQLQSELGPAFLSWKFDEMGEVVSKSWTAKEEQRFEALVKKNPLSSVEGFWELASKCFPSKSQKSMVAYYYNVFLAKRMKSLTSYSLDEVDSDDDHFGHFNVG